MEPPVNGQPVVEDPPLPGQDDHPAAEALLVTVEDFYLVMAEKDPRRIMEFYSSADTHAEWVGQASVFGGVYDGFRNVRLLWASVMGSSETIDEASFTDYSASFVGDTATVSYTLTLVGRGKLVGDFNMGIDVVTVWEYGNGQWTIINDTWDFVIFEVEIVAQGTVFPLHWQKRGDFSVWDERIARLFSP